LDLTVFVAVIAAAFMHASWNVLVKLQLDRFLSLFLIQSIMGLLGVVMFLCFPAPALASLPYALASGVLHLGYNIFLARSYRTGDLSQVYPIARGAAPLLTLIITWFAAHEHIGMAGAAGVLILVAGIWVISLAGHKSVKLDGFTLFFALGTSIFIATYTVVDGLGGRVSGSASAYAAMVFVFDSLFLNAFALATRGPGIYASVAPWWRSGLVGASLSVGAYWIAIWGMSQAHIAAVAALRETSILFVIIMSARVLKETTSPQRIAGAVMILAGAIVLRIA
jgi:drug/metabolite transporter (DMT)-like permease